LKIKAAPSEAAFLIAEMHKKKHPLLVDAFFVCTCSKYLFSLRYCSSAYWGLSGTFILYCMFIFFEK